MASHVAVFTAPFIELILSGKKTVEGRFTKVKCLPFGRVFPGDVVRMKQSGGPLIGEFSVRKVDSFSDLTGAKLDGIRATYSRPLCVSADPDYWTHRSHARYATLIHVTDVKRYASPIVFPKHDRRAWVVGDQPTVCQQDRIRESSARSPGGRDRPNPMRHDCRRALHCFVRTRLLSARGEPCCRFCGENPVNWHLLHRRDLDNRSAVLTELRKEFWRNEWFSHVPDEKERRYAIRKGKRGLRERAYRRIELSVGPATPFRDGTQTPFSGNILYAAQHAVAGCCRRCIAMWHGIPAGHQLKKAEISYLAELLMEYVATIMPDLDETGQPV